MKLEKNGKTLLTCPWVSR